MPCRFLLAAALAAAPILACAAADLPVIPLTPNPPAGSTAPRPAAAPPSGGPAAGAASGAAEDPIIARVNGVELHRSDVEAAQRGLSPQAQKLPLDQVYPALLDRLVDGELIAGAGRKDHLDQDPDVLRRLKRYEDRLLQEAYVNRAIEEAETEDRLRARYAAFVKEKVGKEEVRARHILVATEADAKTIIAELDKGADFAALARKSSTDGSAEGGGDLGYFGRDEMVAEFAAAAFAVPVGQYTKKPIKTQFGWHVIKVEDHRLAKPPSFEEAREELAEAVARDTIEDAVRRLRGDAKIETFGLDGKPLPPAK
jgi:peptidyl-prolyl cis-trans isomerase C